MPFRALLRRGPSIALLVMVAGALSACDGGDSNGKAAAQQSPPPPAVTVAKPLVKRLTEWDEFTGRFEPVQRVEIKARVPGYLQEIGFDDGDTVKAGRMLFVIDPRPYEAALDRAKAQIELNEAQLKLAQLEQERAAKLVSSSSIAKATLDQRDAELAAA